jgi:hypothetical protein
MSHLQSRWLAPILLLTGLSCNMYAVDGVALIDQTHALAGGVTPGDAPGFPVTISLPGSYRLSGNLTVPDANTTAILITADNVTIDLNGFSIVGPTICMTDGRTASCNSTGTGDGVDAGSRTNITVINGTVRGMGNIGINIPGVGSFGFGDQGNKGAYVEKVHAVSNGGAGIVVTSGMVIGNAAISNGGAGIFSSLGPVIGNTANYNGLDGIDVLFGAASGNTATGNFGFGIFITCPSVVVGNWSFNDHFGSDISFKGGTSAGCSVANNSGG